MRHACLAELGNPVCAALQKRPKQARPDSAILQGAQPSCSRFRRPCVRSPSEVPRVPSLPRGCIDNLVRSPSEKPQVPRLTRGRIRQLCARSPSEVPQVPRLPRCRIRRPHMCAAPQKMRPYVRSPIRSAESATPATQSRSTTHVLSPSKVPQVPRLPRGRIRRPFVGSFPEVPQVVVMVVVVLVVVVVALLLGVVVSSAVLTSAVFALTSAVLIWLCWL